MRYGCKSITGFQNERWTDRRLVVHSENTHYGKLWLHTIEQGHRMDGWLFHARFCLLTLGDFPQSQNSVHSIPHKNPVNETINWGLPLCICTHKRSHMHVEDPKAHVRVWWITETLEGVWWITETLERVWWITETLERVWWITETLGGVWWITETVERVWWITETLEHPACSVGWVVWLLQLAFPRESNLYSPWEKSQWETAVVK